MDDKALLLAQVRALLQQLKWAEASLTTAKVDPKVSAAASAGFATLFRQRAAELENLETSLVKGNATAGTWEQLRNHSVSCGELFQECLEFLGGALMRSENKDNDVCTIADALLSELTNKITVKWNGVSLLAEANFYTETTGLIRLPFPDYGTWNLPIAVHELGHFVGPRISDGGSGFPFRDLLHQKQALFEQKVSAEEVKAQLSHVHEFFADLFAVFALGPAYVCSCILLRFNPRDPTACSDEKTHPSHAKRALLIFMALNEMNKTTPGGPYTNLLKNLQGIWEKHLTATGEAECLSQARKPQLEYLFQELYSILFRFLPTLKYNGWGNAVELSDRFGNPIQEPVNSNSIADVLNAEWLWRLSQADENENDVHLVDVQASRLCREIIARN